MKSFLLTLALPVGIAAVWQIAFSSGFLDPRTASSPALVLSYLAEGILGGDLWGDLGASIARDVIGFSLGAMAGVLSGILLGLNPFLRALLMPSIDTLKQVSVFAWIPLVSIWFGLGEGARIFIIAFSVWFPVLSNTFEGVASVPTDLVDVARVLAFGRIQTVRAVVLPAALPSIFTGLYVGLIIAWMVTIGAEYMLTSTRGIGHLLLDGQDNFRMDQILSGCLIVGLVGYALHVIADSIERRVLGWRPIGLSETA